MGSSSVCFAHRLHDARLGRCPTPTPGPASSPTSCVRSRALRRDCQVTLYLPARFRRTATYPLLVVHDGGDFLQYAAAKTVLDNLIHRLDVAEMVVAFIHPEDRLIEYANSTAHARFVTDELVPRLEARAAAWSAKRSGAVPARLELRRRRRTVRRRTGRRTPTARSC